MSVPSKDDPLPKDYPKSLLLNKHVKFLSKYSEDKSEFDYVMSEFLRINGIFWSLTAMDLMGQKESLEKREVSE